MRRPGPLPLVVVAAPSPEARDVLPALTPRFVSSVRVAGSLAEVSELLEGDVSAVVVAGQWANDATEETSQVAQSTPVVVLVDHPAEERRLRDRGLSRCDYLWRRPSGEHLAVLPQRLAEQGELQRTMVLWRAVDHADGIAAYLDPSLRYVAVSRAFARWFGVSDPRQLQGVHASQLLGPELFAQNLPRMQGALRGEVQHVERQVPNPAGGSPRKVWATYAPVVESGQVRGVYVLVTDLTPLAQLEHSLQASEDRWRRLFEILPTGVAVVDAGQRVVESNLALSRILRLSESELKSGARAAHRRSFLADGRPMTTADDPSSRVVAAGERIENLEIVTEMEDGGRVWTSVSAAPLGAGGAVVVTSDITALKRATEELEARTRQLARLAEQLTSTEKESRRELAQRLHDELQQQLVGAKIQVEDLSRVGGPVGARLQRIGDIIAASLATSRSITRDLAPPIRPTADLPAALQWLANVQAEQTGLAVRTWLPEHLSVQEASANLLFSATRELLLNVVKHSGVKEATLTLESNHDTVALTIADVGRGFDPSAMPLTTSRGLGLFSIKERTEFLGGVVSIEASPGTGTRVRLSLPRVSQEPVAAASPASSPSGAAPPPFGNEVIRLVVVDDHATVRESISLTLARHVDLVVLGQASNGREALEVVERVQPHVVLMDVTMPVMDGIEATRHVRTRWPHICVIGLTMHTDSSIVNEMLDAGAEHVVPKGSEMEKLLATIRGCHKGGRA